MFIKPLTRDYYRKDLRGLYSEFTVLYKVALPPSSSGPQFLSHCVPSGDFLPPLTQVPITLYPKPKPVSTKLQENRLQYYLSVIPSVQCHPVLPKVLEEIR